MRYMKVLTTQNFELPTPLGEWMHATHRRWEWVLNDRDQILYRRREDVSEVYMSLNGRWVKEGLTKMEPEGKAASVRLSRSGRITVRSSCYMIND